ncbi:hypothetical protein HYDPIDRAFT_26257 [Hydnomerulius pinastri MD-312]|nr:hypothetical protein HYDPIDRAFT_26257 [Hydnomerulius pinastri MD-312]
MTAFEIEDYMQLFNDFHVGTSHEDDRHAHVEAKPDNRRFGAIFQLDIPENVSVNCGDDSDEEYSDSHSYTDEASQWEFCRKNASIDSTQAPSSAEESSASTISAAQQIIARYRATHESDNHEEADTDTDEKELPRLPDDQRSMYTLATSGDAQSTMDLMWRPKPKVHLHRKDRQELVDAQSQAFEMMHSAGLKPTDRIQCRRRGCADVLRNVEALKYHLHIHNIGDALDVFSVGDAAQIPLPSTRKPSLVGSAVPSRSKNITHSRSKSSVVAPRKSSKSSSATATSATPRSAGVVSPPRKLSAGALFPSLFSPRDTSAQPQYVPSLTAVAASVVSTPSRSKSPAPADSAQVHTVIQAPPSRGRRTRKETIIAAVGAGYNSSIAMILSPPSSPIMGAGRAILAPQTNLSLAFPMATHDGERGVFVEAGGNLACAANVLVRAKSPSRAMSPGRAKSPGRAMSPIRDGLRRVLSIGCLNDFGDE